MYNTFAELKKDYVTRIHLKPTCDDRAKLIRFCLTDDPHEQYVTIGWHKAHENQEKLPIRTYEDYYNCVRKDTKRINPALNIFWYTEENDLFWTRDLDGFYWVCRAKGKAEPYYDESMDIGARVPVEAYRYSTQVCGQIKASFTQSHGGIVQKIIDKPVIEFTKYVYNQLSGTNTYCISNLSGDILQNLPDLDLEELVISYIQIRGNYYVLSNSIARKSTTIAIECEFMSRDKNGQRKAVVQVKGGERTLQGSHYRRFVNDGYRVYLYASNYIKDLTENVVYIGRNELLAFYDEYKAVLPKSITQWEQLIH